MVGQSVGCKLADDDLDDDADEDAKVKAVDPPFRLKSSWLVIFSFQLSPTDKATYSTKPRHSLRRIDFSLYSSVLSYAFPPK